MEFLVDVDNYEQLTKDSVLWIYLVDQRTRITVLWILEHLQQMI
jgi:hypothetical protein